MAIYKISPAAQSDLVDIYMRGIQNWGTTKADMYQQQLIATFNILAENPDMGHSVTIQPRLQRHEVEPYVIFYRKFSYGVRIARILYKNRAMGKYL